MSFLRKQNKEYFENENIFTHQVLPMDCAPIEHKREPQIQKQKNRR